MYFKSNLQLTEFITEYESNKDSQTGNVVKKESGRPGRKKQIKKNQEELDNADNNENVEDEVAMKNTSNNGNSNNNENGVETVQEKDQLTIPNYDIIEQLISPIRQIQIFELWTPLQIATFEAGLCQYGKRFEIIQQLIKDKNMKEVMQFYHHWKLTSHYRIWKLNMNSLNKNNLNNWL